MPTCRKTPPWLLHCHSWPNTIFKIMIIHVGYTVKNKMLPYHLAPFLDHSLDLESSFKVHGVVLDWSLDTSLYLNCSIRIRPPGQIPDPKLELQWWMTLHLSPNTPSKDIGRVWQKLNKLPQTSTVCHGFVIYPSPFSV